MLKILHEIDQDAGGQILVDDPRVRLSENERYLVSSIMEEAIASSQLEGAATTRKKAKEMLKLGKKPTTTAEQMILNNYLTIKSIKKYIDKPGKKLHVAHEFERRKNKIHYFLRSSFIPQHHKEKKD